MRPPTGKIRLFRRGDFLYDYRSQSGYEGRSAGGSKGICAATPMELSQHTIAKVSGPAWEQLRGQFMHIARLLLAVADDAESELFGNYVKFRISSNSIGSVYAAVWMKSSKRLIVGLALPEEFLADQLGPALPGTVYRGLNKYFTIERGGAVPPDFSDWARQAYENALLPRVAESALAPAMLHRAA